MPLFQPRLSPQEATNIQTWISMTCFDVYAWIMFIHVQICILSEFITSGNRELLFRSHNATDLKKEDNKSALERLGQCRTFKSRALWSVRDGKGLIYGIISGVIQPFKLGFTSSKQILRIMLGIGCRSICRILFTKYDILTIPSLYILALAMFIIRNYSYFQTN